MYNGSACHRTASQNAPHAAPRRGQNANGQLGVGDTTNRGLQASDMGAGLASVTVGSTNTFTVLSAGGGHVCGLLTNGHVVCW